MTALCSVTTPMRLLLFIDNNNITIFDSDSSASSTPPTCIKNTMSNNFEEKQDLLNNIIDDSCGKYKFIHTDINTDKFWVCLKDCGVNMDDMKRELSKMNILFGTKEETVHECPQHLQMQINNWEMPQFVKHLIECLIDSDDLRTASNCLRNF